MVKQDLIEMMKAEYLPDFSDGQIAAFVEAARKMVLAADGKHTWSNLLVNATLSLTASEDEYVFPPEGSDHPPMSYLVLVEGQGDTDKPIKIYTEEEWAETDFTSELEGVILRSHAEPGKSLIVFANAPSAVKTMNVVYAQKPGDDLDFVPDESHDVFIWGCHAIIPIKGVSRGEAASIRLQNFGLFKARLDAAIAFDIEATNEPGKTLPVLPIRNMQSVFMDFNSERG